MTLSCLDERTRPIAPQPVEQSYAPTVARANQRVDLSSETWTQLVIPDGTQLLWLDLADCFNLRINFEDPSDDTDGIPLCPTENPNSLPALIPIGDDPTIYLFNGDGEDQVCYASFF